MQVYVKAEHSKMPHGQLKKIVKLPLCAGEEKEINIRLESEAFMLYDENGERSCRPDTSRFLSEACSRIHAVRNSQEKQWKV